jgi:hypothetical protein
MSSTEAEYVALSEATKEAVWVRRLLKEVESRMVERPTINAAEYHEDEIIRQWKGGVSVPSKDLGDSLVSSRPQVIKADNQGCIKMTENVLGNTKAEHVDIRYHYVRDA